MAGIDPGRVIVITPEIFLDPAELHEEFILATGPGGQNVNKVASAVRLRFDVRASASLPEPLKQRLLQMAGKRITTQGELVIEARRFRNQEQNRLDALRRLTALIQRAAHPPKPRHATHPTFASQERRLKKKKQRGAVKRLRRLPPDHES
jgi:ribosome-associated protein